MDIAGGVGLRAEQRGVCGTPTKKLRLPETPGPGDPIGSPFSLSPHPLRENRQTDTLGPQDKSG